MSREVRHDGSGLLQVRFPFDRTLVDLIKTLPNRRWHAAERFWSVPERDVVVLVDTLEPRAFRFDEATCDAYRAMGGSLPIDGKALDAAGPTLPGLFDETDSGAAPGTAPGDYTVSSLNERVKQVLEQAFPQPVWLVGEISGFNRNAHKKHVGFQLVEKDDADSTVSEIDTTLFERTRTDLERQLAAAGDPFRIEDEVTVRMRVSVGLHVPWGAYRIVVEELDVAYTLGEAARRREEILRRLGDEGLLGVNGALPLPALPLSVGLITSLGSDAYNDVVRTLQESGFAFRLLAHGARVQGHATEPSVLNALDALRARAGELDVVLICRGGGSRTDLAWFDSEALGRAVAAFPVPVIVGIGHEKDRSVLDEVGRRAKTPTAAAGLVVEAVRDARDGIEGAAASVLELAARQIAEERRRAADRGRRLGLAARSLLGRGLMQLRHARERAVRGTRGLLLASRERLAGLVRGIPRAGSVQLASQRRFLEQAGRTVGLGARRGLAHEAERLAARERRLRLVDPRSVVERGYAILRTAAGRVVTDAGQAPPGTRLTAELKQGALTLRSEGDD